MSVDNAGSSSPLDSGHLPREAAQAGPRRQTMSDARCRSLPLRLIMNLVYLLGHRLSKLETTRPDNFEIPRMSTLQPC